MDVLSSILVVAFKYPPYSAVGGKRWAKLSKYLARQGVTVHVLTVPWPHGDPSSLRDVSDPRIHIHRVPALTPNRLRVASPTSLIDRARNRIYRDVVRDRSWAQDAAMWWPVEIPAAARLARIHKVDAIVVTGAPFMAGYWLSRFKSFLPKIPLVQDFRDPWADLPAESLVSQGGADKVERLERRLLTSADAIVAVTDGLAELIRSKTDGTPVFTVSNGYDPEDLPPASEPHPRPFRLIHGGNLYAGRQEPLEAFLDAVVAIRDETPELELVFRGGFPEQTLVKYQTLVESGTLKVLPPIDASTFMKEVDDFFATLQFNARHFPYLVSTKIYEYGASGRPVLSVNYGGEIDELVRNRRLGWSAHADHTDELRKRLLTIHSQWRDNPAEGSAACELDQYEYGHLAEEYASLLASLTAELY